MKITRVEVTPTSRYKSDYTQLPTFDNTKAVAMNTCPTWGLVRYTYHKTMGGMGRAMALEAGGAAHDVFAAHRLYSYREYGGSFYKAEQERIQSTFDDCGERLFGEVRFQEMLAAVDGREDFRTRCQQFSLTALYNGGFYDDPGDKRRTTTNIEEMCIAYMDKYDWSKELPYWDGENFLGIEVPVDVIIEYEYETGEGTVEYTRVRFIGKADALHYADNTLSEVRVHENKTASRLGEAWEMSWETNHQPTGYMIALSAILSLPISRTVILGTCLPLPKSYTINGLARVVARREQWQLREWFQWLLHTTILHEQYKDDPTNAPKYTHSCNRYFRPCSFIPLCAVDPDERREMFEDMEEDEWNPLHGLKEETNE